jgi:hypothetical protein
MSNAYEDSVVAGVNDQVPLNNMIFISKDFTPKQKSMAEINNIKTVLFPEVNVIRSIYANYVLYFDLAYGEMYWFNANRYFEVIDNVKRSITLVSHKSSWNRQVVYENGIFHPTKRKFLLQGYSKSGGRYSIKFKNKDGSHFIPRVHQLIGMLLYGEIALYTLGEGTELVFNHKDGNQFNNRPENLEIVTQLGNRMHFELVTRPKLRGDLSYEELIRIKMVGG